MSAGVGIADFEPVAAAAPTSLAYSGSIVGPVAAVGIVARPHPVHEVGAVAAVVRHLGYEKVDLVGYSLGGITAEQVLVRHPDLIRRAVEMGSVEDLAMPEGTVFAESPFQVMLALVVGLLVPTGAVLMYDLQTQRREAMDKRLEQIENRNRKLENREKEMDRAKARMDELENKKLLEIQRVAAMSTDEAKQLLLQQVEKDTRQDAARIIREIAASA